MHLFIGNSELEHAQTKHNNANNYYNHAMDFGMNTDEDHTYTWTYVIDFDIGFPVYASTWNTRLL